MCCLSRGPYPRRTLPDAVSIARQRGLVHSMVRGPEISCDLAIVTAVPPAFVRVRFAPRILATPAEIARDYAADILRLRSIGTGPGISRELWLRSKHGTWRFFRIGNDGSLVELGRDGRPLAAAAGTGPALPGM